MPVVISYIWKTPLQKIEFNLPPAMLAIIFSSGLAFMAFPFSPLSIVFQPVMLALSIKWEVRHSYDK